MLHKVVYTFHGSFWIKLKLFSFDSGFFLLLKGQICAKSGQLKKSAHLKTSYFYLNENKWYGRYQEMGSCVKACDLYTYGSLFEYPLGHQASRT
jgi:hypothetical protein